MVVVMDYFKCERCGEVFDEFEMDFRYASEHGECLCKKCLEEQIVKDTFIPINPYNKATAPDCQRARSADQVLPGPDSG